MLQRYDGLYCLVFLTVILKPICSNYFTVESLKFPGLSAFGIFLERKLYPFRELDFPGNSGSIPSKVSHASCSFPGNGASMSHHQFPEKQYLYPPPTKWSQATAALSSLQFPDSSISPQVQIRRQRQLYPTSCFL